MKRTTNCKPICSKARLQLETVSSVTQISERHKACNKKLPSVWFSESHTALAFGQVILFYSAFEVEFFFSFYSILSSKSF